MTLSFVAPLYMNKFWKFWLILLLCVHVVPAWSQRPSPAALMQQLDTTRQDTTRVWIMYRLSRYYFNQSADSILLWANQGASLATDIEFPKGIALCYLSKGVAMYTLGDYGQAIELHLQSADIATSINLPGLAANNYSNIGNIYSTLGDYARAIENYEKSINLLSPYGEQAILQTISNVGDALLQSGQYPEAMSYFNRALRISRNLSDSLMTAVVLYNIGETQYQTQDFDNALRSIVDSEKISRKLQDTEGLTLCYQLLGQIYLRQNMYSMALVEANKALKLSRQLGNREMLRNNYKLLYEIHHHLGHIGDALQYKLLETSINDSIFALQKKAEVSRIQMRYELSKKQHEIDVLNKDNITQQHEIDRKRIQRNSFIAGFVAFGVLAIMLFRYNAMMNKRNTVLLLRNQKIQEQRDIIMKQKRELEQLNTQKNRILSIISHDIKSPMNSLSAFLSLMHRDRLSADDAQKMTGMLQVEFENTRMVLDNLLFWAKRELNPTLPIFNNFDLAGCIDDVIRSQGQKAQEKNISLHYQSTPAVVISDQSLTTIVLRNLLSNAIKFSKENTTINITSSVMSDRLTIAVRDQGMGIAPEDQQKIFQYDSNFRTLGTHREKGSGLGLALCKGLLEAIGGSMSFVSEPGVGSTFTFSLPVNPLTVPSGAAIASHL